MCVILTSAGKKCPMDWLDKAAKRNGDGQGIAWIEDNVVKWIKSKELKVIKDKFEEITGPYILHFRIATQGGDGVKMCHPFPINAQASLELEGSAKAVLAHNGSNSRWKDECKAAVLRHKLEFPEGPWSDSRAFAWLAHHFGESLVELLDEKICILSAEKGSWMYGGGWKNEDGIYMSNDYWMDKVVTYDYRQHGQSHLPLITGGNTCTNPNCEEGWIWGSHDWLPCMVCKKQEGKKYSWGTYD